MTSRVASHVRSCSRSSNGTDRTGHLDEQNAGRLRIDSLFGWIGSCVANASEMECEPLSYMYVKKLRVPRFLASLDACFGYLTKGVSLFESRLFVIILLCPNTPTAWGHRRGGP